VADEAAWLAGRDPDSAPGHSQAALALIGYQGACGEEALDGLNRALELDPNMARIHCGVGPCQAECGKLRAARQEIDKILKLDNVPPFLKIRREQMLNRLTPATAESFLGAFKAPLRSATKIQDTVVYRDVK